MQSIETNRPSINLVRRLAYHREIGCMRVAKRRGVWHLYITEASVLPGQPATPIWLPVCDENETIISYASRREADNARHDLGYDGPVEVDE